MLQTCNLTSHPMTQDPYWVEQFVRQSNREWRYSEYHQAEDIVKLNVIDCELRLKDVYAKVK
jgi:G:T-mismatch repair DNA endonuclease (very short patch repair protein)